MKRIITSILILINLYAHAQVNVPVSPALLFKAKLLVRDKPVEAFKLYMKYAEAGSTEAMNSIGLLYSKGIGINQDEHEAIKWFEKAGRGGYPNGWYNLGMMYQHGLGTPTNYSTAVDMYKIGATKGNGLCSYALGYMYYKGFGCQQSYEKAFVLFNKGAGARDVESMYMKGLCFRNGYGVHSNLDSAKYWLSVAAKAGVADAAQELSNPQAENTNISSIEINSPFPINGPYNVNDLKSYKKIKHTLSNEDIDGEFTGLIVRFDWSGKHIVGQSPLNLKIDKKQKKQVITGLWTEDNLSTPLTGKLTDSAVIFNNMGYLKNDHYNSKSLNDLQFKDARLQVIEKFDTTYLVGNLQLFSINHHEPEKPIFILLKRKAKDIKELANIKTTPKENKTDSLHFIIYPNPTTGSLRINYTLTKLCKVNVMVRNLLTSSLVYKGPAENLLPGDHIYSFNLNSPPGTYVVILEYGNKAKSAIIFKQ
jgi:hypothetical protein